VKAWFWAHEISKASTAYVNCVAYLPRESAFVTATSAGEVKLWAALECIPLGTINSTDWDPSKVTKYIKVARMQKAGAERVRDEKKA
jgi:hypothetical protein